MKAPKERLYRSLRPLVQNAQQETLQVTATLCAMNAKQLCLTALLCSCALPVLAQWQWIDDSGRKVFSDRPPPAHIAAHKILKKPAGAATALPKVVYPTLAHTDPEAAAKLEAEAQTQTQQQQAQQAEEAAAKQAQEQAEKEAAQEAAERQAKEAQAKEEAERVAKTKRENCQRAKSAQSTLQSGMRLAHVNEKGERGFMTEQQRQADLQRANQAIKDNC